MLSAKGGSSKNEIYVDIVERLTVLFNSSGYVVSGSVYMYSVVFTVFTFFSLHHIHISVGTYIHTWVWYIALWNRYMLLTIICCFRWTRPSMAAFSWKAFSLEIRNSDSRWTKTSLLERVAHMDRYKRIHTYIHIYIHTYMYTNMHSIFELST